MIKIMTERSKVITLCYFILILLGYAIGQYPYIPSFKFWFISHVQPSIYILDKCVSTTLLVFSLVMYLALWKNKVIRWLMVFIVWGMINNFVDEMNGKNTFFSTSEQIGLLFALITTTYMIWKHRKSAMI